jgi:cell division cycle 14
MVVGPQQHWLHINQHHFRAWTHLGLNPSPKKVSSGSASRNVSFSTPQRTPLGAIENTSSHDTPLPAPTPGQPRKVKELAQSVDHKESTMSVVTETTSDGTKVTVNVTTPERGDASRAKRTASYAALGKSPGGGGRRVSSKNAENVSPQHGLPRATSSRVPSGKRTGSTASIGAVKEGRVRKASGLRERVASTANS